jgi:hypothetical protein
MERPTWQVVLAVALLVVVCVGARVPFGPIGIILAIIVIVIVAGMAYAARPSSTIPPGT